MDFFEILLRLDHQIFAEINGYAAAHASLAAVARFCAEWLIFYIVACILFTLIPRTWEDAGGSREATAPNKSRSWFFPSGMVTPAVHTAAPTVRILSLTAGMVAVAAAGVGYALRTVGGKLIARARPYQASDTVRLLVEGADGFSFPSGHATVAFAIACAIIPDHPVLGFFLLLGAGGVALGRVAVGVHYPSDVMMGALLGALVAWGMRAIMKRYKIKLSISI